METEDKYSSFDFNFKKIWEHIKTLPDYEFAVEYLGHVEAQFEHNHCIFIMHIFGEMGLEKYLSLTKGFRDCDEPLPDRTKGGEEILEIAARFAMSELGFNNMKPLYDEKEIVEITKNNIAKKWIAYDEETKAWHFLLPAVAESIRSEFKAVRSAVDQLMHRGRLLRRKESGRVPISEENTEIESNESSNPVPRPWEDFAARLGLFLEKRIVLDLFQFIHRRGFIESLNFIDGKLKSKKTVQLLKGFLIFLRDEMGVLDPDGMVDNACNCFLQKNGNPLNKGTMTKKETPFPAAFKDGIKKIVSQNRVLVNRNFHER